VAQSILTIGFGDIAPVTDAGRGFLFVYVLIGISQLGLVISRISKFATGISTDKVIKQHQARAREQTIDRTVTTEKELRQKLGLAPAQQSLALLPAGTTPLEQYEGISVDGNEVIFDRRDAAVRSEGASGKPTGKAANGPGILGRRPRRKDRRQRLLLLKEEKDRFNAMREIQNDTKRFKQYYSLVMATVAFALLWFMGAVVFMYTEEDLQDLSYYDSVYFCFVCLLTIG
jgi:potassium channel subfamily K, other eukaryote